jgi:hypothetical protein
MKKNAIIVVLTAFLLCVACSTTTLSVPSEETKAVEKEEAPLLTANVTAEPAEPNFLMPELVAPMVEVPTVQTPAVEVPTVQTPTVEVPTVQTPAVQTPAVEVPTVQTPAVEVPAVQTPAVPAVKAPAVSADTIILVFSVNDRIDAEESAKILEAVKNKWFSDKKYEVVKEKDFVVENYIDRIVVTAEARKDYGEYSLSVRTDKVILDDGDALQEPSSEGPEATIEHRNSVDNLIREMRYVK